MEEEASERFIPQPEPYPHLIRLQSQVVQQHQPQQQQPVKTRLTAKQYNYGNLEKIRQGLHYGLTDNDENAEEEIRSPPVLNTTRLLQAKLLQKQEEEFDHETELALHDEDECQQVLNHSPDDRIFNHLPAIDPSIDSLSDKIVYKRKKGAKKPVTTAVDQLSTTASSTVGDESVGTEILLQKRKIKKQVDRNYLKQVDEHKPVLEDLLFPGKLTLLL